MRAPVTPDAGGEKPAGTPRHRWRVVWIGLAVVVGLMASLAVAGMVGFVVFHVREGRPLPRFDSLAAHPDTSLQGTVAYTDDSTRCVRVVAAAGQPSKEVYCLGAWEPPKSPNEGKPMNEPQLVWRDDGRLEMTMFRMSIGPYPKGQAPVYTAEWQKVVDVRTGRIEDVPAGALPSGPNLTTRPTVSPSGQQIASSVNGQTGQAKVTLTDSTGTRTLLAVHGPGEYGYSINAAFWAPNWQWVAVDDGRILLVTPNDPPVTRMLVDHGAGSNDFPTFAVTGDNILPAT